MRSHLQQAHLAHSGCQKARSRMHHVISHCVQGAKYLYMKFILPTLKQHESVINQYVEMGESRFQTSMAKLVRPLRQLLRTAALSVTECLSHWP